MIRNLLSACIVAGLWFFSTPGALSVRAQSSVQERAPLLEVDPDPASILTYLPGVFGYTFGATGWPDGIAPYGADPNRLELQFDGIDFSDLITGRPRFDLVPVALLKSINLEGSGVVLLADSLNDSAPRTNLRYQSAGDDLNAIRAIHVQNRVFMAADSTQRRLQTLFGYAGTSARGEYDGSRLKRAREIMVRLRYVTPDWSAELVELANRRSIGAHTGVIPFAGAAYESIYQRLGAVVGNESARRRTIRNDLRLRGRTTLSNIDTRATLFWTVQTLDYRNGTVAIKGRVERLGVRLDGSRSLPMFNAGLAVVGWNDTFKDGNAYDSSSSSRSFLSALGTVDGKSGPIDWRLSAGPQKESDRSWVHLSGGAKAEINSFTVFASGVRSSRRMASHELTGFSTSVVPLAGDADPSFLSAHLGVGWRSDFLSLLVDGFVNVERNPVVAELDDTEAVIRVQSLSGSATATGVSLEIGFRDEAEQGLYAVLNPVFRTTSTDDDGALAAAWRRASPEQWSSGRIGVRARMFTGDLDLNAYVRARYWGEMGGLRLHTPTGLLALPENASETLKANWLIDFVAEAGVRGAIIYLSYENAFSGTSTQVGNLIIPDYPIPQQRLRFGVYWPIFN